MTTFMEIVMYFAFGVAVIAGIVSITLAVRLFMKNGKASTKQPRKSKTNPDNETIT